jgi:hypothetical protein
MGGVAVALVAVLLVDRARLTLPWAIVAGAAAVLALPFSGTALPVLAGAAILSWIRRGFVHSLAIFAPAGLVYLGWYLLEARNDVSTLGVHGFGFVTQAPVFFAVMFAAGYGQFVGVLVLGPVIAVALLVWLILARRRLTGRQAIAYALLVASAIFAALTAVSRGGGELTAAGAQRYVYLIVMLAIPTMGLALAAVVARSRLWRAAVAVVLLLVAGVNITLSVVRSEQQAVIEQRTEREFSAAVALARQDPDVSPSALPIRDVAPDLTMADVESAVRRRLVSPVPFGPTDTAAVEQSLSAR